MARQHIYDSIPFVRAWAFRPLGNAARLHTAVGSRLVMANDYAEPGLLVQARVAGDHMRRLSGWRFVCMQLSQSQSSDTGSALGAESLELASSLE